MNPADIEIKRTKPVGTIHLLTMFTRRIIRSQDDNIKSCVMRDREQIQKIDQVVTFCGIIVWLGRL